MSETPDRRHRLLLVDDHPIVRTGLAALIEAEPDLVVCAQAEDADAAIAALERDKPDLAIIDLSLRDSSGLDVVREATRRGLRTLVVSMQDSPVWVERSLSAGARGYVHKSDAGRTIVVAIRRVLAGRLYVGERLAETLLQRNMGPSQPRSVGHPVELLTDRELDVFVRIGRGLSTRNISEALNISAKTVQTYRERIKKKLGLELASELSREAARWVMEGER
jgi:DNA-binding NarL/FixJ family response regulator